MIASFAKAIAQLPDPRMARVVLAALAVTIVLYLIVLAGVWWLEQHLLYRVDIFGWHPLTMFTEVLGWVATFIVSLMLFPSVTTTMLSFLVESVARAVESRYYPALGPARRQGVGEMTWQAVRFALVMLLINLLALPVYIPLAIFFGLGAALYFLVNGYLLGREYFEQVAMRRLDVRSVDALRRAHLGRIWVDGIILALISTVPIANLFAPVIGTAAMLHEFEALRRPTELL
jgi:uncharacterized protein involved in cysteine biosynthesis